ncbi:hypothetical protein [Kineococcus glutinatus]|uniref:Uncharacterized protein n=1 Tax=Kineococcus glutinatus TaxID=1070872 RepID=A0ABP9HA63_9ACTN
MLIQAFVAQVAEEAEGTELPMSPLAFGIVAMCVLVALLLVTFAFRNTGSRH